MYAGKKRLATARRSHKIPKAPKTATGVLSRTLNGNDQLSESAARIRKTNRSENAKITHCSDQSITESYCLYVHRSRERFSVEQASLDKRVEGHPKRRTFQCYYGIPLFDSEGKMLGTVCHFDSMPVRVTEAVAEALDDLAPLISEAAFGATLSTSKGLALKAG